MNEEQIKFERDERGLVKGVNYQYFSDGTINWRAMIPEKFLYVQNSDFKADPKKVEEMERKYGKHPKFLKVSEVEDRHLSILLAGFRYLANLRGFLEQEDIVNSVHYDNRYELTSACTVTSKIRWIANFESNGSTIITTGVGGATLGNTDDFVKKHVETAASNRAFVRNVRGFLNIAIVGKDELAPAGEINKPEENQALAFSVNPQSLLEDAVKKLGLDFKKFKKRSIEYFKEGLNISDPSPWESYASVSPQDSFTLLGKVTAAL